MSKNTTINLRVNKKTKEQAAEILSSLGLTLSETFNLLLHQVLMTRGLPFEVKQHMPIELNDMHGSYVCEYGHTHDYKKIDFEAIEKEIADPNTKIYDSVEDMWAELDSED